MRIVFLGDSLTWGGYGGNFVDEVARLLPQHEIINEGVGGSTVLNLLERLDEVLTLKPDGIFVMIGGNDAISFSQPETQRYYRRSHNVPDGIVKPEVFARTYRDLLTRIVTEHVLVWIGLPPIEYNPATLETLTSYNTMARDIADKLGIPVLDMMEHFPPDGLQERPPLSMDTIRLIGQRENNNWDDYETERVNGGYTFSFDGLHLTPEAANRMAALIVDFLDLDHLEGS
jgi:lysophospholipase L1-like esterase